MPTPDPALAPWKPRDVDVRCSTSCPGVGCRTPSHILAVVAALDPEGCPRYTPDGYGCPGTRCNILLWDFTRAMGAEVPHWANADGEAARVGAGREESADDVCAWLDLHGPVRGWAPAGAAEAQAAATSGRPAVVGWPNLAGVGHVAVVLPMPVVGWSWGPHMGIAQAGRINRSACSVLAGFGWHPTRFWTHA